MTDSRLILPDYEPEGQKVQDKRLFKLPCDDEGTERYLSFPQEFDPATYFNTFMPQVQSLIRPGMVDIQGRLAHGSQLVWVFAAQAYANHEAELGRLRRRLEELEARLEAFQGEGALVGPPR